MDRTGTSIGVIDKTFLAQSVSFLRPPVPLTLPETAPAFEAIRLFQTNKIGCVVILDTEGKLSGMFTERDVVLKLFKDTTDLHQVPISGFATTHPQTIQMTTSIAFALNMMCAGGYRHLPIVDDEGYPVGIISVKNILDYIAHSIC
jgi:CBS domain-containing protein